jgi:RNA polymerase sigma-70 factor (TIGR02960 family)
MRYPPNRSPESREKLVRASAGVAKRSGFAGTGVDALAKAAGFTSGAFYRHFEGKADLLEAIVERELETTRARFAALDAGAEGQLLRAVDMYLSVAHVTAPEVGCVLPALSADVARAPDATRAVFEQALRELLAVLSEKVGDARVASALLTQCVGAVTIARALATEHARREVLGAARQSARAMIASLRARDPEPEPTPDLDRALPSESGSPPEFQTALAVHRPALLRHCYRMLGSYADAEDLVQDALARAWQARASYRGEAPLERWLHTIATHACLNALARRRRLSLPQLERDAGNPEAAFDEREPQRFLAPAPDARLFPDAETQAQARQTVTLAFIALLQRVPPRQRAALLLRDVLGWTAEEAAAALDLSLASVNSAVHRGRKAISREQRAADEPSAATLREFVRAWEARDLDALVALLRVDLELAMPPYPMWFRGLDDVLRFLCSAPFASFWAAGVHLVQTRANGRPAFAFYRRANDGRFAAHSIMVARFLGGQAAELTVFLGADVFPQFDLPLAVDRTVPEPPMVSKAGGTIHDP